MKLWRPNISLFGRRPLVTTDFFGFQFVVNATVDIISIESMFPLLSMFVASFVLNSYDIKQ